MKMTCQHNMGSLTFIKCNQYDSCSSLLVTCYTVVYVLRTMWYQPQQNKLWTWWIVWGDFLSCQKINSSWHQHLIPYLLLYALFSYKPYEANVSDLLLHECKFHIFGLDYETVRLNVFKQLTLAANLSPWHRCDRYLGHKKGRSMGAPFIPMPSCHLSSCWDLSLYSTRRISTH